MEHHTFTSDYLTRLAQGDAETQRHFTSYFSGLLGAKLRVRLRSHEEVDDVRQETFLRVIRYLRNGTEIEHPERFGAFVNTVSNHVLLEHYRARARYQQPPEETPEPADGSAGADDELVNDERKQQVRRVLAELPGKEQLLLRRVFFEERDKDEVCDELGVDREYLRVLVHRAKNRFRDLFLKRAAQGAGA